MHKLHSLKEKLCDELSNLTDEGVSSKNLQTVDTVIHALKNLTKYIMMEEGTEEGYSGRRYDTYGNMNSYANGPHTMYSQRPYTMGANNYNQYGMYSRTGDINSMVHELRDLESYLPPDRQDDIERLIVKMKQI